MFLKAKHDAQGKLTLWKARLVNGGHMTDPKRYDPFEKTIIRDRPIYVN